ncbi:MAG: fasciclin domain-containing protein [Candidatus Binatia bacterium]
MLRKVIAVASVVLLMPLIAEAGSSWKKGKKRGNSELRQCLKTDPVHFNGTIVDAAVATPDFSTLVTAVTAAGLVDALSQPGNLTVFAPTNDAFANIPPAVLHAILADQSLLTSVLTYHVVAGSVHPRIAVVPREVDTLQGQGVFLSLDRDGPRVNQSNIACQAVQTSNGTIWIIDSVLLPQF